MKKACSKCGKIHEKNYVCTVNQGVFKRFAEADIFRNRRTWKRKAEEIRNRDLHLCQVCVRGLYNTMKQYNSRSLSVHHIVPLAEDFERRLDHGNLITLCTYHHELAERGKIPRALLFSITAEQEKRLR